MKSVAGLFGDADHQGAAFRQFAVGDFCGELQVGTLLLDQVAGGVVEEVDYVASEAVFEAAAFIEIERAYGIHFQIFRFAQGGA